MASTALAFTTLAIATGTILVATWHFRKRIHIGEDFALARRRLPALLTGVSQAINSVPMWMLMAVSLMSYAKGLAAIWLALANLVGLAINWWLVAPQLRAHTTATASYTLSQWFAASAGENMQAATLRSAAAIVVFALGLMSLTCLQWAAQNLAILLDCSFAFAAILLVLLLLSVTFFGGLWSASFGDIVQAVLLVCILPVVIVCALVAVGGWHTLWSGVVAREPIAGPWFGGYSGVLAIALLVGVLFAGLGGAAQPQVTSRYLACRDEAAFRRARELAMIWSALTLLGALLVGWCARILLHDASDSRVLLSVLVDHVAPAAIVNAITAAITIILALACASPWVALATHVATDFPSAKHSLSLTWCRAALLVCGGVVVIAALNLSVGSEDRLWLCWQSLSAAFGPLLFVRLTGKKVRPGSSLGAMWSGFILTVLFHLMPDTPGDLLERSLPFIAALGIALSGGERRRNPDRADRGDKTVHDHLPI